MEVTHQPEALPPSLPCLLQFSLFALGLGLRRGESNKELQQTALAGTAMN